MICSKMRMKRGVNIIRRVLMSFFAVYAMTRISGGNLSGFKLLHMLIGILIYRLTEGIKWEWKTDVLSILFAVFLTAGYSMNTSGALFDQPFSIIVFTLMYGIGCYVILKLVIGKIAGFAAGHADQSCLRGCDSSELKKKTALTLAILWLPYYLALFPGGIWWDTKDQLSMYFGYAPLNNMNPFLQTIISGVFVSIGKLFGSANIGAALYTAVQYVVSVLVITELITLLARIFSVSRNVFRFTLLSYALIPIFPLYACAVGKDMNWSVSILLCLTCVIQLLYDSDAFLSKWVYPVLFSVSLVLVSLLRNSGLPIALLCVLVSLPALKGMKKKGVYAISVVSFALVILGWNYVLLPGMGVSTEGNAKENYSVPLMQIARAVNNHPEAFDEADYAVIDGIVDVKAVQKKYNPNNADSIKKTYKDNAAEEEIWAFRRLYGEKLTELPACYMDAVIAKSYAYFDPDTKSSNKPFAILYNGPTDTLTEEELEPLGLSVHYPFEILHSAVIKGMEILENLPVVSLLFRCGIWTWAYIAAFICCVGRLSKKGLWVFLPGLAVLIGAVFTPVNGYFRYVLPSVMMVPAALMVCVSARRRAISAA